MRWIKANSSIQSIMREQNEKTKVKLLDIEDNTDNDTSLHQATPAHTPTVPLCRLHQDPKRGRGSTSWIWTSSHQMKPNAYCHTMQTETNNNFSEILANIAHSQSFCPQIYLEKVADKMEMAKMKLSESATCFHPTQLLRTIWKLITGNVTSKLLLTDQAWVIRRGDCRRERNIYTAPKRNISITHFQKYFPREKKRNASFLL